MRNGLRKTEGKKKMEDLITPESIEAIYQAVITNNQLTTATNELLTSIYGIARLTFSFIVAFGSHYVFTSSASRKSFY